MLQPLGQVVRYVRVVAVHKWAILAAGLDVRAQLAPAGLTVSLRRLLAHDLSKLSGAEFMPYARHFGGPGRAARSPEFEAAWRHHYRHNDHHPEHFQDERGHYGQMPEQAVVEMVVDWLTATRAYEGHWPCCGGHWRWLEDGWDRLELHPANKALAGAILCALGYGVALPGFRWDEAERSLAGSGLEPRLRALRRQAHAPPT